LIIFTKWKSGNRMKSGYKQIVRLALQAMLPMILLFPAKLTGSETDSLKLQLTYARQDTHKVWLLRDIAFAFQSVDRDSAIYYSNLGYALAGELNFPMGQIWTLYQKAIAYELKDEIETAFTVYFKALNIAVEHRDKMSEAKLYNAIGVACYFAGRFHDAVLYYTNGYSLSDSLNYIEGKTHALNNLGVIYRLQHRYQRALDIYYQSLVLKRHEHDTVGIINSLYNIGLAYSYLNQYEKSLESLMAAKNLSEFAATPYQHMDLNIDIGIGVAYFNLNQTEKAKQYLKTGLEASKGQFSPEWIAGMSYLGAIDVMEDNATEGLKKIEAAYAYAENSGRIDLLRRVLKDRAIAANAANQYALAIESWHNYAVYTDSFYKVSNQWAQEEMQARFELHEKTSTIALQQLQLEQESRRIWWYAISGIFLAVLLISSTIFLFLIWKQRERLKTEIGQKEAALRENEFLMKEMHHRTKNNLQLLESLLNIQMRSLENPHALQALQTSRDSVNAIGLLHHQLYKTRDLRKVPLQPYIHDLVRYFKDAFALQERNIELQYYSDNIEIDIDKATPLGLIMNELITNSIKHAFGDGTAGKIDVQLIHTDDHLILQVEDNGTGFNNEAVKNGTGKLLLKILGEKLKATVDYTHLENKTAARFSIPL